MDDHMLFSWCFTHFYHLDMANAAIHNAPVRYSPITFRLAERLDGYDLGSGIQQAAVSNVMRDKGRYAEDTGR